MNKDRDEVKNKQEEEIEINEAYKTDEDTDFDGHDGKSEETALDEMAQKIKKLEEMNADYLKSLQRERADFENYRRRNQTAVAEAVQSGMADVLTAVLPVIDNFERALAAVPEEEENEPFVKGVTMVYKHFRDILAKLGLEEIPAEGECFDPNVHHAVAQESAEEGEEEGNVKEVLGKGYMFRGKVLRPCMVKVVGS